MFKGKLLRLSKVERILRPATRLEADTNTDSTYFLIRGVVRGVCRHAKTDITDESKISFLRSVKLLIAPLEVCIWRQDLRRSFQSNSG